MCLDLGLAGVACAVAGSSKGLGRAVAEALANEGARVAICSRDQSAIGTAAEEISKETGSEVHPVVADVSTKEGAESFIDEAVIALGGLQVLVCNSGGPPPGMPESFDDEAWLNAIDLIFLSTVRMVRRALPHLLESEWSRVVAITSSFVRQPVAHMALSSATRSASTSFLKTLSLTHADKGLTVNTVIPGQLLTDRLAVLSGAPEEAGPSHEAFRSIVEQIPAGRLGDPAELGAAVAFLCSKKASFINGVNLPVDGGHLRAVF